jgi:capsular polysaccharide transport system ATP-binding protein
LIGGVEQPTAGKITQTMRISWPLAFTGAFQGGLTGIDNVRFICRVYGKAYEDVIDFVEDFSQLGRFLKEPVKIYSSGMRARLAFAVSLMIDFDCYLIDEVVAVGDARFQQRSHEELFEVRKDRAIIIVSHDPNYMKLHCDNAAVLEDGRLRFFDEVQEAFDYYAHP